MARVITINGRPVGKSQAAQPRHARLIPPEPNAAEMAVNLATAAAAWAAAGFPVVPQAEYDARSVACAPCQYWDGRARLGLGKCKAPGCGCTKLKRWLATEKCKHPEGSRWPASGSVPADA